MMKIFVRCSPTTQNLNQVNPKESSKVYIYKTGKFLMTIMWHDQKLQNIY